MGDYQNNVSYNWLAPKRNVLGVTHPLPIISSASSTYSRACSIVRIPPAALKPIVRFNSFDIVFIVCNIISAAWIVAPGLILPVEVLIKSAPPRMADSLAAAISALEDNFPVSRITFNAMFSPQAFLQAWTNSCALEAGSTTSISWAPSRMADWISCSTDSNDAEPDGKLATVAILDRSFF